ncbi:hypothetical protein [Noviherbaspirillum pedocola]|uniref:Uncharacterized protein n=1 Tax=Noviherbaspirillum pedocola TaxID=2801341 RepID=A0A934WA20_9BURK|nr:hypothetical protein [Noviherbaspirillum pedocola]MBK4737994.1 hypothetical protein [Noviherbaspirillum pedocola]
MPAGIRSDIRLAETFATGKPIREYAAKSRDARAYAALAGTPVPAWMPAGQALQAMAAALD